MSSVKLFVSVLSEYIMNKIKGIDCIIIYDVTNKRYEDICDIIFKLYCLKHVILVGQTVYRLPIHDHVIKQQINWDDFKKMLSSASISTFSISSNRTNDTCRLWCLCYYLKP